MNAANLCGAKLQRRLLNINIVNYDIKYRMGGADDGEEA